MSTTVTFTIGQVVPWPPAPLGFAQVYDLRRTNVQLCYPKHGRIRRPLVAARTLARLQERTPLLLTLHNPFDRGLIPRQKTFVICAPPQSEQMKIVLSITGLLSRLAA